MEVRGGYNDCAVAPVVENRQGEGGYREGDSNPRRDVFEVGKRWHGRRWQWGRSMLSLGDERARVVISS